MVTGATGFLGRYITKRALERGHRVIGVIREKFSLNKIQGFMREFLDRNRDRICFVESDLEKIELLDDLVEKAYSCFGDINVLINSAAVWDDTEPFQLSYDKWIKILSINLVVPYMLAIKVSRYMREGDMIINISCLTSTKGHRAYGVLRPSPAYVASKTALNSVTKYLADLLAPKGIIVIGVAPSWIKKPEISRFENYIRKNVPLGRAADPDEIADIILSLAENKKHYLSGSIIELSGGY